MLSIRPREDAYRSYSRSGIHDTIWPVVRMTGGMECIGHARIVTHSLSDNLDKTTAFEALATIRITKVKDLAARKRLTFRAPTREAAPLGSRAELSPLSEG